MTYIIGPYIIVIYSLAVIHLISPWNVKLFHRSSAIVVVIGRPVHRIASIVSSHLRYKTYAYI